MTVALACLAGAFLAAVLVLTGLAAKERDNRFCVSCHLHEEKFDRFVAKPPTDLAGFHQQRKHEVGCIACHGGADIAMRLHVWEVAAIDTLKFIAGRYRESIRMALPLRDAECRRCHSPILARSSAPRPVGSSTAPAVDPSDESTFAANAENRGGTSYHAIRDHDSADVRCVSCHVSHATDSDASNRFISKSTVTPICRQCHKTL